VASLTPTPHTIPGTKNVRTAATGEISRDRRAAWSSRAGAGGSWRPPDAQRTAPLLRHIRVRTAPPVNSVVDRRSSVALDGWISGLDDSRIVSTTDISNYDGGPA